MFAHNHPLRIDITDSSSPLRVCIKSYLKKLPLEAAVNPAAEVVPRGLLDEGRAEYEASNAPQLPVIGFEK